jgi:hypothetical protein
MSPLCFDSKESSQHLFMYYPMSLRVQFASLLGIQPPPQVDLILWLLNWLSSNESIAVQFLCVSLWKIWYFKKQVIFQQGIFEPVEVVASVLVFVHDYNQTNPIVSTSRNLLPPQVWFAPLPIFLKANIDVDRDQHDKVMWGLVI